MLPLVQPDVGGVLRLGRVAEDFVAQGLAASTGQAQTVLEDHRVVLVEAVVCIFLAFHPNMLEPLVQSSGRL